MSEHALYSPSSCYRNLNCLGAIYLSSKAKKQEESIYAKEGTEWHDWIKKALTTIHSQNKYDFDQIPNLEMRQHTIDACAFIGEVNTKFRKTHHGVQYHIEKRVKFDTELWGTADYVLTGFNDKTKQLEAVIIDFKYGRGVEVGVEENEQLLCYGICLQQELTKVMKYTLDKLYFFIYQPRTPGEPYARWQIDFDILQKSATNIIKNKTTCLKILRGEQEPEYKAGEWCRFCDAKPICKTYMDDLNSTALKVLDEVPEISDIKELSLEQKLEIFKRRKVLKAFIDSVGGDLLQLKSTGKEIPGWKLVEGQRKRMWNVALGVDVIEKELNDLGASEVTKKSLIGIGEVEKQIGKGLISDLTTLTKPSYQLVPEDDKRQAIEQLALSELTEILIEE